MDHLTNEGQGATWHSLGSMYIRRDFSLLRPVVNTIILSSSSSPKPPCTLQGTWEILRSTRRIFFLNVLCDSLVLVLALLQPKVCLLFSPYTASLLFSISTKRVGVLLELSYSPPPIKGACFRIPLDGHTKTTVLPSDY